VSARVVTPLRIAGALALLGLASLSYLVPWWRIRDDATRARYRWWVVALEDGKTKRDRFSLFLDAKGKPVDREHVIHQYEPKSALGHKGGAHIPEPLFVATMPALRPERDLPAYVSQRAAYASAPDVPKDPWGNPWYFVIDFADDGTTHFRLTPLGDGLRVYSAGPDGKFEFGKGDDIDVETLFPMHFELRGDTKRPEGLPWDFEPLFLDLAVLVAWCWVTWRGWAAARSPALWIEVLWTTLAASLPGAFAYAIASSFGLGSLDLAQPWQLVGPRTSVGLTAAGVVWAFVFWRRHARELPPREELG
jgi:hypothetical protein